MDRRDSGSSMVEFAPTIGVILLFMTFPMINLIGLATSAATVMLLCNNAVSTAASQATYTTALNSMFNTETSSLQTGFAKFSKITPIGGFNSCGIDLFTQVTKYGSSNPALIGPNTPVPPPIDTTDNLYEYAAMGTFRLQPLFSMASIPFLGSVPGLGQPVQMSFRAVKMVEHPQGLSFSAPPNNGNFSGQAPDFPRTLIVTQNPNANVNQPVWRTPNIFNDIAAAGQTVVSVTVMTVNATDEWKQSGIILSGTEKVWVDSNAIGIWGDYSPQYPQYAQQDANGFGYPLSQNTSWIPWAIYAGAGVMGDALIGCIGPTPPTVYDGGPQPGNWNMFQVGNVLTNYPINGGGALALRFNNNSNLTGSGNARGQQLVRIIVTH